MSKETNRIMGHSDESDGIEEYDNPLPDWWVGLFWLTIAWAIGYGLWYHVIADRSQVKGLEEEMAAAQTTFSEQPAPEAAAAAFAVTPEAIAAGATVYAQNCVPCHGAELQGVIGPSFLDDQWIHGGQAADIIRTITEGVPAKGMVTWKGILTPEQINHVAAYVISKNSEATGRPVEDILKATGGGAAATPAGGSAAAPPPTG